VPKESQDTTVYSRSAAGTGIWHNPFPYFYSGEGIPTQGADIPQAIVDGGETTTVLGVADLGQKRGRAELGERHAETKEDTPACEDADASGGSLHYSPGNHKATSQDNRGLAAKSIRQERATQALWLVD
jgi:hypothetical protein